MSELYAKVAKYYSLGAWTKKMVANAVAKGWITEEEYLKITGEEYA